VRNVRDWYSLMQEFNKLLSQSGLTRDEVANMVGVTPKTTYNWNDNAPRYVITILEQHIKLGKYYTLVNALKDVVL